MGNFRTINQIYRLLKRGCYAFRLLVCKQLHGNGFPLSTTSAIIDLKIVDLLRKVVQHGSCANSHGLRVVTRRPFFRALDLCRQQPAEEETTRGKKGSSSSTFGGRRNQPPPPIAISSRTEPDIRYNLQYKYTRHGN